MSPTAHSTSVLSELNRTYTVCPLASSVEVPTINPHDSAYKSGEDFLYAYQDAPEEDLTTHHDGGTNDRPFEGPKIIKSSKDRGQLFVYKGHLYRQNGRGKEKNYWKCHRPRCKSVLHAIGTSVVKLTDHYHDSDYEEVACRVFKNRLLEAVELKIEFSLRAIYNKISTEMSEELRQLKYDDDFIETVIKNFQSYRSVLERKRKKLELKVPVLIGEIIF